MYSSLNLEQECKYNRPALHYDVPIKQLKHLFCFVVVFNVSMTATSIVKFSYMAYSL